nr:lytic transglycosylase domain-containing protein [Petrachloros mirabilis]
MQPEFSKNLQYSVVLISAAVIGTAIAVGIVEWHSRQSPQPPPLVEPQSLALSQNIADLVGKSPSARASELTRLARAGSDAEQTQARFLLAADNINQQQGAAALPWLQNLDQDYPLLAPEVLVLQARAQTQAEETQQAQDTWETLLGQHPEAPATAEALYVLGRTQPQYWDQLLTDFPSHPRAVEVAVAQLANSSEPLPLLRQIAEFGLWLPNYTTYLDRLTQMYAEQLTPEDWQNIGFGYWETLKYEPAARAYARAPRTATHAYRVARGLQLGTDVERAEVIAAYEQMIRDFPESPETALALMRLADLSDDTPAALALLDQAIEVAQTQGQSQRSGEALLQQINRLSRTNQPQTQAQQTLLQDYGDTEAAATWRWEQAQGAAKAGNLSEAKDWAFQVLESNSDSNVADVAAFWAGKWSEQLGQTQERVQAFQQLWQQHPDSYYAWRAAALSGWDVGDFNSVRSRQPTVYPVRQRPPLESGSPALQELYLLGQDRPAWERWQWEFSNRQEPSLADQYTDGLLRIGVGDYLDGIFMLTHLQTRVQEKPNQREDYEQWQQSLGFWQAKYPLAFAAELWPWAEQRQLNPLLVLSLIRQESRFQTRIRSVAGAVGLMQVMPETAEEIQATLQLEDYDLEDVADNLNLGTWYLDFTHRTYEDNSMLAIASYNAGPGNVDRWLQTLPREDVDAFIEAIPFPETRNYVKAVFGNYWNYLRLYNPAIQQQFQDAVGYAPSLAP